MRLPKLTGIGTANSLSRYKKNNRGNAAMIFALALLPIMTVAGFAIDRNRQQSHQTKIQNALDFAVISTAREALKNSKANDTQLKKLAQEFFDAELSVGGYEQMTLNPVTFNRNGDMVTLDVRGTMPTSIMQIIGTETMPIGTESAAVFGEPASAEIALVLDTSYSMKGTRMDTLRTAAQDMVHDLVKPKSDSVKISIVPFATYVNVGTDKKGESWLDVESDKSGTWTRCTTDEKWRKKNCEKETYTCTRDGIEETCTRWECDDDDEDDAPKTCKDHKYTHEWHGCVKSRDNPYNIKDSNYSAKPVEGFVTSGDWACPTEIQELTHIPGQLQNTIAKLKPQQDTYLATGLTWGFRTLTSDAPFDEAQPFADFYAKDGRKALVLMSDGANTKSPSSDGKHNDGDVDDANDITEDVCDEIKDNGIELYTIAFEIDDKDTKKLLQDCASDPDLYFDATNSAQLKDAFKKIGDEFREIALAR